MVCYYFRTKQVHLFGVNPYLNLTRLTNTLRGHWSLKIVLRSFHFKYGVTADLRNILMAKQKVEFLYDRPIDKHSSESSALNFEVLLCRLIVFVNIHIS